MKSFKKFLVEKEEMSDEDSLKNLMRLNAGFSWTQSAKDNPYTRGDLSMVLAKDMEQPSMAAHKAWETDVGVAFNQDPSTGELYGDQEGFKMVHKRDKEGRNVKFKTFDYNKYREGLLHRLSFGLIGTPEE